MTTGNPVFCFALYLTSIHFRGELQHVGDTSEQKFKCRPIKTREIGGVRLSEGSVCKGLKVYVPSFCYEIFDKPCFFFSVFS